MRQVHNLLGAPGAIVADLMMQMLGLAAAMLLMPLALTGWRLLVHRRARRKAARSWSGLPRCCCARRVLRLACRSRQAGRCRPVSAA